MQVQKDCKKGERLIARNLATNKLAKLIIAYGVDVNRKKKVND